MTIWASEAPVCINHKDEIQSSYFRVQTLGGEDEKPFSCNPIEMISEEHKAMKQYIPLVVLAIVSLLIGTIVCAFCKKKCEQRQK